MSTWQTTNNLNKNHQDFQRIYVSNIKQKPIKELLNWSLRWNGITVLKYPNCKWFMYIKAWKELLLVETSRKHNLISCKLTFSNSQNSTVMECIRSRVSLKQKKKRNIYLKVLWRAYLSDWLQPQHKVGKIWLNCLRRKAFNISPLSVMLALGFYTCPLSDWRRSLLLLICWRFLSLRYYWGWL